LKRIGLNIIECKHIDNAKSNGLRQKNIVETRNHSKKRGIIRKALRVGKTNIIDMQNLNGTKWQCNGDGMTYNFTQLGNNLFVAGVGNNCYNVGFGTINPDNATIILQWADTPNSAGMGNHGICFLDASQNNVITKTNGSPSFGIGNFTKIS
jgi:hypothetical protein